MAFRHWQGSVPVKANAWKCPTCGNEVSNPLEQGCPHCQAGRDAAQARVAKAMEQALTREGPEDPEKVAFDAWFKTHYSERDDAVTRVRLAFAAGAAWAAGQQAKDPIVSVAKPEGGWVLGMGEDHATMLKVVDPRTTQTILAALTFYRDHQLGYGTIPGQLSAQECSELITKLSPTEEPAP
jgi:hypothetical protein